jgi:ATP-dependent phosphoenolpyruvate carboxykinase
MFYLMEQSYERTYGLQVSLVGIHKSISIAPTQARTKIRVVCARPYHALFMHNMLIRPTPEELASFGEPDFVIYNSGDWEGCTSLLPRTWFYHELCALQ